MRGAPKHLAAGGLERAQVVSDADPQDLLDLRLVGRAGGDAAIVLHRIARVHEDGHPALPAPPERSAQAFDEGGRHEPGAVV